MRDHLHLILSTDATLADITRLGMLSRTQSMIDAYRRAFDFDLYTADAEDYSDLLRIRHHPCCPRALRKAPRRIRQAAYYADLLRRSGRMRGIVRVLSSNLAILPEIKRISGSPVIVNVRYDWSEKTQADYRGLKRILAAPLQRRCLRAADLLIASTPALRERMRRGNARRVILIPNFVDTALFYPRAPRVRRIVFAGRLHWAKGCAVLLEAFAHLAKVHADLELVILGTGEQGAQLRSAVPSGLAGRVHFLGSLPQEVLAEHVGTATAFAFPTLTVEGHPKALIEAMASGTPCVCASVPGVVDLIEDNRTGLLVPPGDVVALARALDRLLADPGLWQAISQSCLRASRRFEKNRLLRWEVRVMKICASGLRRGTDKRC